MQSTLILICFGFGEAANTKLMNFMNSHPRWELWSSKILCSVIQYIQLLISSSITWSDKSYIKWEDYEISHALCCGLEITKSCKVFNLGGGDKLLTLATMINYSSSSSQIFSIFKAKIFHISSHHLLVELVMQAFQRVGIFITGEFGLLHLLLIATKLQLVVSIANLVLKVYQFGGQSYNLRNKMRGITILRLFWAIKGIIASFELWRTIWWGTLTVVLIFN